MRQTSKTRSESQAERDLRMIADVLSGGVGDYHLRVLVEAFARALSADAVAVGRLAGAGGDRIETVAYYRDGQIVENITYQLANTPCVDVLDGKLCVYADGVRRSFSRDARLQELHAEGYAAAPLVDSLGRVLGLLSVISSRRFRDVERVTTLLRIFGARAALEMERNLMDQRMFDRVTGAL